jgi:Tfp pilus assembly protein PilX
MIDRKLFSSSLHHPGRLSLRARQQGLALAIALIALAAMSLSAIALVWAVNTSINIQGNLAFRANAEQFAERAAETARTWLLDNRSSLAASSSSDGYYATDPASSGVCGASGWTGVDFTGSCSDDPSEHVAWKNANGDTQSGSITPKCEPSDADTGALSCYVINRLCAKEGSFNPNDPAYPAGQSCKIQEPRANPDGDARGAGSPGSTASATPAAVYRITVRVGGPRGNAAYTQTFVLI